MTSSVAEIVSQGRKLSKTIKQESSLDLEAAHDHRLIKTIPAWRHNCDKGDSRLHRMISRVGGFPPSLARYFVARYSTVGDTVLDPFCGKGTALLEAICLGRNAVGGDIAPDAVVVSRAKCSRLSIATVANYVEHLGRLRGNPKLVVPDDVAIFFSTTTLRQLLQVRAKLLGDMHSSRYTEVATFVCGVLLGLLHGHSRLSLSLPCNQAFAMSPNYVRRYVAEHGLRRPDRDVCKCVLEKALELLPAPRTQSTSRIFHAPAQQCDKYVARSRCAVNLVVTSPPYLNRQTYIKDSWLRLWFLGCKRSEQAANSLETGNVLSFVQGLQEVLPAMSRALVTGGRLVMVCGHANLSFDGQDHAVRVADLCLYALRSLKEEKCFAIERLIKDKKLMIRGSYFAVHRGHVNGRNGQRLRRYGEDEILILRKVAARGLASRPTRRDPA
jgi:SAM-dependent methyltransferase